MPTVNDFKDAIKNADSSDRVTVNGGNVLCTSDRTQLNLNNANVLEAYEKANRDAKNAFGEAVKAWYRCEDGGWDDPDAVYNRAFPDFYRKIMEDGSPLLASFVKQRLVLADAWWEIEDYYHLAKQPEPAGRDAVLWHKLPGRKDSGKRRAAKEFRHAVKAILDGDHLGERLSSLEGFELPKHHLTAGKVIDVAELLKEKAVSSFVLPVDVDIGLEDAIDCYKEAGAYCDDTDDSTSAVIVAGDDGIQMNAADSAKRIRKSLDRLMGSVLHSDGLPGTNRKITVKQFVDFKEAIDDRYDDLGLEELLGDCEETVYTAIVLTPFVLKRLFSKGGHEINEQDKEKIKVAIHELELSRMSRASMTAGSVIKWTRGGKDEAEVILEYALPSGDRWIQLSWGALHEVDSEALRNTLSTVDSETGRYELRHPATLAFPRSAETLLWQATSLLGEEIGLSGPCVTSVLKKIDRKLDFKCEHSSFSEYVDADDPAPNLSALQERVDAARSEGDRHLLEQLQFRLQYDMARKRAGAWRKELEDDHLDAMEVNARKTFEFTIDIGVSAGLPGLGDEVKAKVGATLGVKFILTVARVFSGYTAGLGIAPKTGVKAEAGIEEAFEAKAAAQGEIAFTHERLFNEPEALLGYYHGIFILLLMPDIKGLLIGGGAVLAQKKERHRYRRMLRGNEWLRQQLVLRGVIGAGDGLPIELRPLPDYVSSKGVGLKASVAVEGALGNKTALGGFRGEAKFSASTEKVSFCKHYSLLSALKADPAQIRTGKDAYFKVSLGGHLDGTASPQMFNDALETIKVGIDAAATKKDFGGLSEYKDTLEREMYELEAEYATYCDCVNAYDQGSSGTTGEHLAGLKRALQKTRGVHRKGGRGEYLRALTFTYARLAHLHRHASVGCPPRYKDAAFQAWQARFEGLLQVPRFAIEKHSEKSLYIKKYAEGKNILVSGLIYLGDDLGGVKGALGGEVKLVWNKVVNNGNPDNDGEYLTLGFGLKSGVSAHWAEHIATVVRRMCERNEPSSMLAIDGMQVLEDVDVSVLTAAIGRVIDDLPKPSEDSVSTAPAFNGNSLLGCEINWVKGVDNTFQLASVGLVAEDETKGGGSVSVPVSPGVYVDLSTGLRIASVTPIVETFGPNTLTPYLARYHGQREQKKDGDADELTREFVAEYAKKGLEALWTNLCKKGTNAQLELAGRMGDACPKFAGEWNEESREKFGDFLKAEYGAYVLAKDGRFQTKGAPRTASDVHHDYCMLRMRNEPDGWERYTELHHAALTTFLNRIKGAEGDREFNIHSLYLRHYNGGSEESLGDYYASGHRLMCAIQDGVTGDNYSEAIDELTGYLELYHRTFGPGIGPWTQWQDPGLSESSTLYALEHGIYYRSWPFMEKQTNEKRIDKAWRAYVDKRDGSVAAVLESLQRQESGSSLHLSRLVRHIVVKSTDVERDEKQRDEKHGRKWKHKHRDPILTNEDMVTEKVWCLRNGEGSVDARQAALKAVLDYLHLGKSLLEEPL